MAILGIFAMFFSSCSNNSDSNSTPEYNNFVEAFTHGKVSRHSTIFLIFNQEIPNDKLDESRLEKLIIIKPKIEGSFHFETNKTIAFTPKNELESGTTYTVEADLSEWFDVSKSDETFTFSFEVLQSYIRGKLSEFAINPTDENKYDLTVSLSTADVESDEDIEKGIIVEENGKQSDINIEWTHGVDGISHNMKLVGVQSQNNERTLAIKIAQYFSTSDGSTILETIKVPSQNSFSVYDIKYINEPERYIEVIFNKNIDTRQKLTGLAYITDNTSESVKVKGNTLRLFPDATRKGIVDVILNANIKSSNGLKLGEDVKLQIEVDGSSNKPQVEFVGSGVIIPQSDQIIVPFKAVNLHAVTVKIIKIFSNNIGQFLQNNDMTGYYNLMYVGRIVALKTIFLDEDGADISQWNNYGINLTRYMTPEPGAIYRVELSFTKDFSAWPSLNNPELSKTDIERNDALEFASESNKFDRGGYYYTDYETYWWDDCDDPSQSSYYHGRARGKNIMATNLGITMLSSDTKEMIVSVNNLITAQPESNVKIIAYNFQNQEINSFETNGDGLATLTFSEREAKPFYLLATKGSQRTYLKVDDASALSLSKFDIDGDARNSDIKGFIYGERGVWRPGDTLHICFMLNDILNTLPEEHPITLRLYNSRGQLYSQKTTSDNILGIYRFDMATDVDAPTGVWEAHVEVGGNTFSKNLRVETIKPNRLKIDLELPKVAVEGKPLGAKLHSEWLTGSTANSLSYDINATFSSIKTTFDNFKGYTFDNPIITFNAEECEVANANLDENGNANINVSITTSNSAPGMLSGNFTTRIYEPSGEFSTDVMQTKFSPYTHYVGIKSPIGDDDYLVTGKDHTFNVATVDCNGIAAPNRKITVNVYQVEWYWWWHSSYDSKMVDFISDSNNRPVKTFTLTSNSNGLSSFVLNFTDGNWGTYYIEVKDNNSRHRSGLMSYFDTPSMYGHRSQDGQEASTQLSFSTDKTTYQPGEKMAVTFPSSEGSRALVSICKGSRILKIEDFECTKGQTTINIDVTDEMRPNIYLCISLIQPHANVGNDQPIRLYGIKPITITSPASYIYPQITVNDEIKPETNYNISIKEKDGREMAYTLAIVDEGLLDLTHFKTPNAWATFNAREALGVRIWDMYKYVVGAFGGRLEQLFSIGGDDALENGKKAIVNRFTPVVQVEGPFYLKKGETKKHNLYIPNYNGRVRVMVVAGDGKAYGSEEKSVLVRKNVMVLGTLPRVIGIGETMDVPATIFATKDGIGEITTTIECSKNMTIEGQNSIKVSIPKQGDTTRNFRIKVKDKSGKGYVKITSTDGIDKAIYETEIDIRSVAEKKIEAKNYTIEAGKTLKEQLALPGLDGTNKLTTEISNIRPINLAYRLSYLLAYPHGCVEQTTSKIFPQLYLSDFTDLTDSQKKEAEDNIKMGITRLRSFQLSSGAMSYWPGSNYANDWGSAYVAHFFIEAEKKGFIIPSDMKNNLINSLRSSARSWSGKSYDKSTQCYRLFVLALAGKAETSAMNRIKQDIATLSPSATKLLAAAYALSGSKDVAKAISQTTITNYENYYYDYGSELRTQAINLVLLSLLDDTNEMVKTANEIADQLADNRWLSTQETAFSLFAMANFINKTSANEDLNYTISLNGKEIADESTKKHIVSHDMFEQGPNNAKIEVENNGKGTIFLRTIAEGELAQGEIEAFANNLSLSVNFTDNKGHKIDISNLKQGSTFKANFSVGNTSTRDIKNVVLSFILPSGWENLSTPFVSENGYSDELSYRDIRDDRVYCYIDNLRTGRSVEISVELSATYSGEFYLPAIVAEAMYDNTIRANNTSLFVKVE